MFSEIAQLLQTKLTPLQIPLWKLLAVPIGALAIATLVAALTGAPQ